MDVNVIREKAKALGFPILDYLLGNPRFIEMAKIMSCCDHNIPVRINGKILKIAHYDYFVNPYNSNTFEFQFETAEWSGSTENVMDINTEILKDGN